MPEIDKGHNRGLMALDRVLLHVRRGPRVVKRAVNPADVYFLETGGGDTLVRLRGATQLRDVPRLAPVAPLFEPFGFLPIHRSYAVNLRRLREL
jgi:DNA-binding LytR/AlgR family response regulator